MSSTQKIRVAVLRGGPSSEYEVSLQTGETILKNLPEKYEGIDVFISREGVWHVGGFEKQPAQALTDVDVAFIALHGQYGEDGEVQRVLERLSIPFTGSGSDESALAMNKHSTKRALLHLRGKVKTAVHKLYSRDDVRQKGAEQIFKEIIMPSVVKPLSAGSSVGVSIVKTFFDLAPAIERALEHSDAVIIEEFIPGREATCGVIDDFREQKYYSLLPVEILPAGDSKFYDYNAKYLSGETRYMSPASFSEETKIAIQEAAKLVHSELGLRHYSRSDFIVHPKRGVYFLEVNTLPGMTSHSIIPKSVEAIGLSLPQFLDHVLTMALADKQ